MTSEEWFGGSHGRNRDEAVFLRVLRDAAASWTHEDLREEDTAAYEWFVPLYVTINVPGLTAPLNSLEVTYRRGAARGPDLAGGWGSDKYPLDDTTEDLLVRGLAAEPEQMAAWAAGWMNEQLHRGVLQEEWAAGGRVTAARWRRADDGVGLGDTRGVRLRMRRTPPHRVERLRGDAPRRDR